MTELICVSCGYEQPAPEVCCGAGVPGKDPAKLYCPAGENHGFADMPEHCGQPMKVVANPGPSEHKGEGG